MIDVRNWLLENGFERFADLFEENDIDGEVLFDLTDDDLKDLDLTLGSRKKLLSALAEAAENAGLASAALGDGRQLTSGENKAERRQLTVMFCDLVGSTALSERLDPEEMRDVLGAYQKTVSDEIARFDGFVAKFMGDGVLAYFGWPRAHEDDAERAVRASLAAATTVSQMTAPTGDYLAARVGIATGLVVVGDLTGDGAAQEAAVVGDAPILAARLQALAEPSTVVISPSTRRLLGDAFETADLGQRTLKGIVEPVRLWRVLGESQAESRFEALHGVTTMPLLGRDEELELLLSRWRYAKNGEGQVVLLAGEPGIGKSRLVKSLRDRLREEPHTRLGYFCSPYHTNSTLFPVLDQLERASGFARTDPPEVKLVKLEAALTLGTARSSEAAALLAVHMSIPPSERYPPLDLAPEQHKQRTLEVLLEQLCGLAAGQPVLLILEDAHWIDPTSVDLFEMIVERLQTLPVLLVVTFRPEYSPPWTGYPHTTSLALNRLGRFEVVAIIEQLTEGKALPAELVDQILAKTDGVPLFVEELTKTVLESGLLKEADARFELGGSIPTLAIPATIHDSLMARLDRLGAAKAVAQLGAVIGREFPHELLAAVTTLEDDELLSMLDQLLGSELIFRRGKPPGCVYIFKHALVRDAAYASLLKKKCQSLHENIATALIEQFPQIVEQQPEVIAHHYSIAGLFETAIQYWHQAGQKACEHSANMEAIVHINRGLELLGELARTPEVTRLELELYMTLGPALMSTRGWSAPEVEDAYRRARELCTRVGTKSQLFAVTWGMWVYYQQSGQHQKANPLAEELLPLARANDDRGFLLQAHHAAWTTQFYHGNLSICLKHADEGISIYSANEHRSHALLYGGHDPGMCCRATSALVLWFLGYPDQALARAREAVVLAEQLGHTFSLAHSLFHVVQIHQFRREPELTQKMALKVTRLSEENGFAHLKAAGTVFQGWALAVLGHTKEGIDLLLQGLDQWRGTGAELRQAHYLSLLAEGCCAAGEQKRGLAAVEEALKYVRKTGEIRWKPDTQRIKGDLLLKGSKKQQQEAETCFKLALDTAHRQNARSLELRAVISLAGLWRDQSKFVQARDLLDPVFNRFTEGFDTADLENAKALLNDLS